MAADLKISIKLMSLFSVVMHLQKVLQTSKMSYCFPLTCTQFAFFVINFAIESFHPFNF